MSKEWIATAAIALLGCATVWGSIQANQAMMKDDIKDIKAWKDSAISQMGDMNGKLDALLRANDVVYRPKR